MGMLAPCAYILAMDTFGPITDNAGGIIEMSKQPEAIRHKTDRLDAVGNTTKALTKGYAIGSAALAAFLLFSAYLDEVKKITGQHIGVDLTRVPVFVGGLLGATLVFVFSALAIKAVGKAAQSRDRRGAPAVPREPRHHGRARRSPTTRAAWTSSPAAALRADGARRACSPCSTPIAVGFGFKYLVAPTGRWAPSRWRRC